MNISININLPQVWEGTFSKEVWNPVNYIVGPNGTGKSLFSVQLKDKLQQKGYKVRLLSAERLAGFEKASYSYFSSSSFERGLDLSNFTQYKKYGDQYGLSTSAFIILKERLDIRIKIEAILSDLFKKTIRLVEVGGYLQPRMQKINGGNEYILKDQECHGLKEIISLLTFLYDDEYNCIIFDEPELHLHPQFQSFFLNEIRKIAGNPNENPNQKLFFIITHSPYFLDLRSIEDLKHILVCHHDKMPNYIHDGDLDGQDLYVLNKFLPRFNTHHKQFFFSSNPVFVEGYTDQQIISLLFERIGLNISASGSSVIDVGGKDELAVFYKLCKILNIDSRIIADYDALFRGKLREVICADGKVKTAFNESGHGSNVSNCIGEVEKLLSDIGDELYTKKSGDADLNKIVTLLQDLYRDKGQNLGAIRDVVLLGIHRFPDKFKNTIPNKTELIESAIHKHQIYLDIIKTANIYIIPNGELEHFFKASPIDYLNIHDKDKLFIAERDNILNAGNVEELYNDILPLLKEAIPSVKVDIIKYVRFTIIDFIQNVQKAVERQEVTNVNELRNNGRVDYKLYNQILECRDDGFTMKENGKFECTIYIKSSIIGGEKQITFSDSTTAREFNI